jgi:hypothetical protein
MHVFKDSRRASRAERLEAASAAPRFPLNRGRRFSQALVQLRGDAGETVERLDGDRVQGLLEGAATDNVRPEQRQERGSLRVPHPQGDLDVRGSFFEWFYDAIPITTATGRFRCCFKGLLPDQTQEARGHRSCRSSRPSRPV